MAKIKKANGNINFYSILLLIAILFMSIGYASINNIRLDINGSVMAKAQEGIFISDVYTNIEIDASIDYYETLLHSTISLPTQNDPNGNPPQVTYNVQVYNSTNSPVKYNGAVVDVIDSHFYSNPNIEFKVEGINVGQRFDGKEINFTITFYFKDNVIVENNVLESYIRFEFNEIKIENLDKSGANRPMLTNGLIPVMFDESKNTWVTADENNFDEQYQWYDYDNQMWANAVLVNSSKRNSLDVDSNGYYTPGQEIGDTESDGVLAFYVWIPRYKYKVWDINKIADVSNYIYDANSVGVDIVFEKDLAATGGITCNYSFSAPSTLAGNPNEICIDSKTDGYYTHPAFTFGNNKLTGFWMGKFEISGSTSNVKILPNVTSLRNTNVTTFWRSIYDMQNANNVYGLNADKTNVDTHMITNMEWGAVVYLAHSKYGRCIDGSCTEIGLNSCNLYKTGCGPQALGSNTNSSTCNSYTTELGMNASTTNNIYGVYDMSGGAYEHVMGNMSSSVGNYTYYASNGGTSFTYNSTNQKYLNIYANINSQNFTNQNAYNIGKLGDATSEVVGWYDDIAYMPSDIYSWFLRSGGYQSAENAGLFYFARETGLGVNDTTIRSVLTVFQN